MILNFSQIDARCKCNKNCSSKSPLASLLSDRFLPRRYSYMGTDRTDIYVASCAIKLKIDIKSTEITQCGDNIIVNFRLLHIHIYPHVHNSSRIDHMLYCDLLRLIL